MTMNENTPQTTGEPSRAAEYERPKVTDLGSLQDLTLTSTTGVQSDALGGSPGTGGS
jgi:hypothetical protein